MSKKTTKLVTIICFCLLLTAIVSPITSFAASSGSIVADTSAPVTFQPTTAPSSTSVPVWGYIGLDATITPNTDPSIAPSYDISPTYINVTLPAQVLWAAFEGDAGAVTAPNYTLTNNDPTVGLVVWVQEIDALNADATTLSTNHTLTLTPTGNLATTSMYAEGSTTGSTTTSGFTSGNGNLVDPTTGDLSGNTNYYSTALMNGTPWTFSLTGSYTGTYGATVYPTALQPKYSMVLVFDTYQVGTYPSGM